MSIPADPDRWSGVHVVSQVFFGVHRSRPVAKVVPWFIARVASRSSLESCRPTLTVNHINVGVWNVDLTG